MKKLMGAFLSAGLATSAMAQEQAKDSVLFWDTTDYGVILDYFAGELDQYKGRYNGNLMAVFGLRVDGAYDKLRWNIEHCSVLVQDQGAAVKERLNREFSDVEGLRRHNWLSKVGRDVDAASVRNSIGKAVDQAVDACSPKLS